MHFRAGASDGDDLAKDAGFDSLDEMRKKIAEEVARDRDREVLARKREALLESLREGCQFHVPDSYINFMTESYMERLRIDKDAPRYEEIVSDIRRHVEKNIRDEWILQAIAEQEGIEISEEEVDEWLSREGRENGRDIDEVKNAYLRQGIDVKGMALRDKVIDFLINPSSDGEMGKEESESQ